MAGDLLQPGLSLVFCGYNPSLVSGSTGRHYAHLSNRFWSVLHAAGITAREHAPEEDEALLLEEEETLLELDDDREELTLELLLELDELALEDEEDEDEDSELEVDVVVVVKPV